MIQATETTVFNTFTLRSTVFRGNQTLIQSIVDDNSLFEGIEFFTYNNVYLDTYFVGSEDNPILSFEFEIDEDGSNSFRIELAKKPSFPVYMYTKVYYNLGGKRLFAGYIENPPVEGGDNVQDTIEYQGSGFRKRLENLIITNPYIYFIKDIAKTGTTIRIRLLPNTDSPFGSIPFTLTDTVAIVRDSLDEENDTKSPDYRIIDASGNDGSYDYIEITKADGVDQTIESGYVQILPTTWRDSNLWSDIVDYTIGLVNLGNVCLYNSNRIEETTGQLSGGVMNWHNVDLEEFFKHIRDQLGEDWFLGVDGEGYIFLSQRDSDIKNKFFCNYDFSEDAIELKWNYDKVRNIINVERQKGGGKWSIASSVSDASSIQLYGRAVEKIQVPNSIEDTTADLYANQLLADLKDPRISGTLKNMEFRRYDIGNYNVITRQGEFEILYNEMETFTDWTTGANITRTLDPDCITGAFCHKLEFTNAADGERHIYSPTEPIRTPGIKTLIIYVRSNIAGQTMTIEYGEASYTENSVDVRLKGNSQFYPIELDLSGMNISEIGEIAFQFSGLLAATTYFVYIDRISTIQNTAIHYELPLKKLVYRSDSRRGRYVDMTFGLNQTSNLAGFLQSQSQLMSNNRLMFSST